ncbi:transcription-repair coupling factor [Myxococcus xanthus]|uniref:Transcription-repair-coupling factor n=1 Tax=Myxococcus xanthus TaxID=34 RepID=A0AAE6FWE1_MYXXA|nr:transcription-repair coupling factor [Myxococcus xanthus]QDE66453.1 transcription-repair coupling factor [Myxococcus xanthus]QDE73726.1 transcription-repair coupling factor [Myxococcus xanthus]
MDTPFTQTQDGGAAGDPFAQVVDGLRAGQRVRTQGLKGAARGHVLARLHGALKAPLVCVAVDEEAADALAADLSFFLGGQGSLLAPRVLRLPADEVLPYDEVSPDAAAVTERLGALFHLGQGTRFPALVLSVRALHRKVLPLSVMRALAARVAVGQDFDRDSLARRLVHMGYQNSPLVEDVGTFSVRGDLLDVFSPLYDKPVRLEFFGDTIESIRAFDPQSQRTVDALKEVDLVPAREVLLTDETRPRAESAARAVADRINLPTIKLREQLDALREGLPGFGMEGLLPGFFEGGLSTVFDFLRVWSPEAPVIYLDDPLGQDRAADTLWEELERSHTAAEARQELICPPLEHFLSREDVNQRMQSFRVLEGGGLSLAQTERLPVHFSFGGTQDLREAILAHHGEEGALSPLVERLERWRELRVACVVACGTLSQADRLKRLLMDRNVVVKVHTEPLEDAVTLYEPSIRVHLFTGEVSHGFVDGPGGLAVLADEEIFGVRARRRPKRSKKLDAFGSGFGDLKEGDLIVHTDFGIGRYAGLTKMEVNGVPGDFLVLEYAGRDKIYLPVGRMRLIQKFSGGDPTQVQLDKLGTTSWEKTKKRVKEQLLKMAAELLQIAAARKAHPGHAFSAPDRYFAQFEADFEFEETPDQAKAIEDVLADMQKPEPMDRLVCGDVGYGKTEVAMRAAFKAALDRKQVAVLVPTTVLAQQHFLSFKRRFADYPVTVEVISGMKKAPEVREILKRAKEGKVDILIGTHKLLGGEVAFKELGLMIVDEEQRFGVKQKESLKKWRSQIDVLTLTATPIPRTLHMSMSGVRDMSIIATPPQDRRAIRTFVMKYEDTVVKEAIEREVARGGQVFFVHNRVESLPSIETQLRALVPQVSIGVAHGQMGEGQLEKVMLAFTEKKYQVLLCTSIIESGIDISSANTMIVNRADQFGLAQLYQLRGRVGRSKERAYAYLLVPSRRAVTKDAQRRLEVLQNFTELGAGFSIASHDLEIRGAGNLLGDKQSGAIAEIGFDMYAQLLEEAVAEMQGQPPKVQIEPDVTLPMPALIPDDYVSDVHQRLVFYKRFSQASHPDEVTDLRAELVDRYGEAPDEVDHLSELTLLKIDMRDLRLRGLEVGTTRLVVTLGADALLDGPKVAGLVQRSKGVYRLTPDMKLIARAPQGASGHDLIAEAKKVLRDLSHCALPQA